MKSTQFHVLLAGVMMASMLAGFICGNWHATPSRYNPRHKKVFVLAIAITFEDKETLDRFMSAWAKIAAYVKDAEPDLLSYELSLSDANPLRILVFERYVQKSDYTEVHRSSPAFFQYKEDVKDMKMTIDGHSYYETNIGHM